MRLAKDDVIQYIKDANSDPYMITRLRMKLGDKLGLFYGHDNNALGAFAFGATGWVSGSGNFDPRGGRRSSISALTTATSSRRGSCGTKSCRLWTW